jgi:hypothetical protein
MKSRIGRAAQDRLDFRRQLASPVRGPLRQQSGMHQAERTFTVTERAMAQPAHQFLAVGRVEDVVERVTLVASVEARGGHQQVEVVIAEHGGCGSAQVTHKAQGFQ